MAGCLAALTTIWLHHAPVVYVLNIGTHESVFRVSR